MAYLENLQQELFFILAPTRFSSKYYGFYETHSQIEVEPGVRFGLELLEEALLTSGLTFKYIGTEDFFETLEKWEGLEIGLKVALHNAKIKFVLVLKTGGRCIEWPFWGLAAEIELLRDSDFEYFPRNPKLPVSNPESLKETVNFGLTLYKQVREAILSHKKEWSEKTMVICECYWSVAEI